MAMSEKQFRTKVAALLKSDKDAVSIVKTQFSRQKEEDPYVEYYNNKKVVKPPYDFDLLYTLYEESDALQSYIDAMVKNVLGMGWSLSYLGDDTKPIPGDAQKESDTITNLFDHANEDESWLEVALQGYEDFKVLGNQATEVIRDLRNRINLLYYHPMKPLRLLPLTEEDYQVVDVTLPRDGKDVTFQVTTPFRRFVKIVTKNGVSTLRHYKSFGDPRPITIDGRIDDSDPKKLASELLWFKQPFGGQVYGMPEWLGSMFDVAGRRDAQSINWDLLRNQGIAPLCILVEGKLTDDSWEEIYNMIEASHGIQNFNKVSVLQVVPAVTGVGQKGSAKITLQFMNQRDSDQMFNTYLDGTEERIRKTFRIPPGFIGATGAYSYSTLYTSKVLGEEQVFGPERIIWDKRINRKLLQQGFGIKNWKYKTKAAEVQGGEEMRKAMEVLQRVGALSTNNAIRLANDLTGRDFSTFSEKWADIPENILAPLIQMGYVPKIPGLEMSKPEPAPAPLPETVPENGQRALPPGTQKQIPQLPQKIEKTDDLAETVSTLRYLINLFGSDVHEH